MDDAAKIEAYKDGLRITYGSDAVGLRKLIAAMMTEGGDTSAVDSVVINSASFEGEQSTGILVLEPMIKLRATIDVLREIDPDNTPAAPASMKFADFSDSCAEL